MKKICLCCQRELDVSAFGINPNNPDGFQSWCKECINEYGRKRKEYRLLGGVKYCRKCHQFKPRTDFNKNSNHKDGLQSYCKECDREHGKLRNGTTGVYRLPKLFNDLSVCSVDEIMEELRRRGYKGKLTKTEEIEI